MDDVLAMNVVYGGRDAHGNLDGFLIASWKLRQQRLQSPAGYILHDNVGLNAEIAFSKEFRYMGARQARQDHLLHFEADDRTWIFAFKQEWHLHDQGNVYVGTGHAPEHCHAAGVDHLTDDKSVDDRPRGKPRLGHSHRPRNKRSARWCGSPAARIPAAAVSTS